jgi:hypothetical protein
MVSGRGAMDGVSRRRANGLTIASVSPMAARSAYRRVSLAPSGAKRTFRRSAEGGKFTSAQGSALPKSSPFASVDPCGIDPPEFWPRSPSPCRRL